MAQQIPIPAAARADTEAADGTHEVAPDLAYERTVLVNVVYAGPPGAGDRGWVLIDAGVAGTAGVIAASAAKRFGNGARPSAVILTHGHFDHVGALKTLAERWACPVYAHEMELPYLDGRSAYPPPDPTVGGGLMATLSRFYPSGPINVGDRLKPLPADGTVPGLPGWVWMATPGHSPGHVSFWRAADKLLIAGDAFITTAQESAYAVALQSPELHGPPMYFTPDWAAAKISVERLAALEPAAVVTGHGRAMGGPELRTALHAVAKEFDHVAVPARGRYVGTPATADANGVTHVPPLA